MDLAVVDNSWIINVNYDQIVSFFYFNKTKKKWKKVKKYHDGDLEKRHFKTKDT